MNRSVNFAGLFATTVAIFLITSYKSISPDTGVQRLDTLALLAQAVLTSNATTMSAIDVEPFRPTPTAIAVSALWSLSVVFSLLSALLAMMTQDWLSGSMGMDTPPMAESLERYALNCLQSYAAITHYGVDQLATCVIGLMHSAVVLFLVGLSLFLAPLHCIPAILVAAFSAVAAVLYVVASVIPLFDPKCPYRTPLSLILFGVFYGTVTFVACVMLYFINVVDAVGSWIANKKVAFRDLDPREVIAFLGDPVLSARVLRPLLGGIMSHKSSEELGFIVDHALDLPYGGKLVAGRELSYLSARARAQMVKSPGTLRYFARCLLSMEQDGVSDFFVNLRNSKAIMIKLARVFDRVNSVDAAVGSIRFLQMLVSAENSADNLSQSHTNQDARWKYMPFIVSVFPSFAEQVGERGAEALLKGDTTLHTAVASLRWTLIGELGQIQGCPCTPDHAGFQARLNVHSLLTALDAVSNLRLLKASVDDHEDIGSLLQDCSSDPRPELAYRNALTLLDAVHRCNWRAGDWERPDARYMPRGRLGMWEWRKLFEVQARGVASECMTSLFDAECVKATADAKPGSAILGTLGLGTVAGQALRDLRSTVNFEGANRTKSSNGSAVR
ncbi:unnamed protein product, partial [Peniophora sp. CBMAI 1063]